VPPQIFLVPSSFKAQMGNWCSWNNFGIETPKFLRDKPVYKIIDALFLLLLKNILHCIIFIYRDIGPLQVTRSLMTNRSKLTDQGICGLLGYRSMTAILGTVSAKGVN
jgi:hypothetical protein